MLEQLEIAQTALATARQELRHWLHDEDCDYEEEQPQATCTCGLSLVQTNLQQAVKALTELRVANGRDGN